MADTEYTRECVSLLKTARDFLDTVHDGEYGYSECTRDQLVERIDSALAALPSASLGEPEGWIPVSERLPEQREKPYQVIALCVKRYKEMCYAGEPIRGVYQDWVLRNWPQNYTHWMPFPDLPSAASPASKSGGVAPTGTGGIKGIAK